MLAARNIALIIHIMGVAMVFAQLPIELYMRRLLKTQRGTPAELSTMLLQGRLMAFLGSVGGIIILLTGLVLVAVSPFRGVLGIGGPTPMWLVIKQIIYIIIIILIQVQVQPTAKRVYPQLAAALQGAGSVTEEARGLLSRMETTSLITSALVVVNIILAVWKPS